MAMDKLIETLQYLEVTGEIGTIDEFSTLDVQTVKELVDVGLVEAIDASSLDGPAYLKVRINLLGREWLKQQLNPGNSNQSHSAEDIVEVKPNFMGIGLNLNALWKKWFKKKT
jgi:hypothetical protein